MPAHDELFDAMRARIATSAYHVANGITLVELVPGRAVLRMELKPQHLNPQGIAHGGAIAGLLDSACGLCLRSLAAEGHVHRTVQLNINYLRSPSEGVLTATGTAVHTGRTTGLAEAEATDDQGRLVGRATATFVNLEPRRPPGE